jgi:hypothetical protein
MRRRDRRLPRLELVLRDRLHASRILSAQVDGEAERRRLANTLAWAIFREPAFVTRRRLTLLGEEGLAEFVAEVRCIALILVRQGCCSPSLLPNQAQDANAAMALRPDSAGLQDRPGARPAGSNAPFEGTSSPTHGHQLTVGRARLAPRDSRILAAACLAVGFAIGFAVAAFI